MDCPATVQPSAHYSRSRGHSHLHHGHCRSRLSTELVSLWLWLIAIPSVVAGALVLEPYFSPTVVAFVTAYGFRSDFLHLPLIFILPAVFNIEDVKRIGWWTLLGMIPMGILMAIQFRASPD